MFITICQIISPKKNQVFFFRTRFLIVKYFCLKANLRVHRDREVLSSSLNYAL